jgi:hypothetical protein
LRALAAACFGLGLTICAAKAAGPDIWLAPIEPFSLHDRDPDAKSDFLDMFRPDAPWADAAAHVAVIKNATAFVLYAPDKMLSEVLKGLKQRGISYALETGLLPISAACGKNVEGFMNPGGDLELARKIQRLGGVLKFVAMDEPLWYGHYYSGVGACRYPISEIARQIAIEVKALRQVFPQLEVGDIEPVGTPTPNDWPDELMRWVAEYHRATDTPLDFLHADVDWVDQWRPQLHVLAARLHAAGVSFGIIFIGKPADTTGEEATRHAEQRMSEVASDPDIAPDQAVIQSWLRQPQHNLPETQPGTMTYLVDRYLATNTILTARRDGGQIVGRLEDEAGHPVRAVPIQIIMIGNNKAEGAALERIAGTVPSGAASAVLGLRINTECSCSGAADVSVGDLRYLDQRDGQAVRRTFGSSPDPEGLIRFVAPEGQPVLYNAAAFPVSPGGGYLVEVPVQEHYVSEDSGYAAIIFLNPAGKEIKRDVLLFPPTAHQIGQAVTDAVGHFAFPLDPRLLTSSYDPGTKLPLFRVSFPGTNEYRISSTLLR